MAAGFTGSRIADKSKVFVNLIGTNVIWPVGVTTAKTTRAMYITSTSETDASITIKFPGAPSKADSYRFEVGSTDDGLYDTSSLPVLTVEGTVTSISPITGSIYGGTVVTIVGGPFSTDLLDNPVQIGGEDCIVSSSTATTIVCTLGALSKTDADTGAVAVFLKLSEEA